MYSTASNLIRGKKNHHCTIRVRASSHVLYYLFFVVESAPRHMTSVLSV